MKIVHVMDWYIPNMGYQENFFPSEQKKLGYEVEIVCSDRFPKYGGHKENYEKYLNESEGLMNDKGVNIHRLPSYEVKGFTGFVILKGLKQKLKELNPDVIQAHGPYQPSTVQAILWSKSLNYKIFIDDHSHENNFSLSWWQKILVKSFYNIYVDRVSSFMPVTYSSEYNLKNILNIKDEKLNIIQLGVNDSLFNKSDLLREECRKEFNLDEDEFLLLTSGKFTKNKDIDILIRSLSIITEKIPNIKLLVLGDGPSSYMNFLKSLVKKLNLSDNVIFKGFVKNFELPKYYNAADIGIWPGDHSITVIEASATGLPIIIPNNILAYKILVENDAAVSFTRGNPNSLADLIINLSLNVNQRDIISGNAIKLTKNELSWKKIARKSIDIYSNFISSS
jgi:glycosyltransferase involved in cell wall biosynthesis